MARLGKYLCLFLVVILAVSSLLLVGFTNAQSILKPAVPEFTVEFVAHPYDVPTTTSTDPYTGKEIIHQGYHVENASIQVSIKNQEFNPFNIIENENPRTVNIYYNIRIRGHFAQSQDWVELYRASDGYPHQWSDSDFTVLSYTFEEGSSTILGSKMISLPADGLVDFQVESMIGYIHREITIPVPGTGWVFTGETSGWSNTQTLKLSDGSISESNSPNPSPTIPEFPIATLLIVLLTAVGLLVIISKKRNISKNMTKLCSSNAICIKQIIKLSIYQVINPINA